MPEKRVLILQPGSRIRGKHSKTLYLVRRVTEKIVIMLSEDGKNKCFIQKDSPLLRAFEPVYD